jgi:hypothetical protein
MRQDFPNHSTKKEFGSLFMVHEEKEHKVDVTGRYSVQDSHSETQRNQRTTDE